MPKKTERLNRAVVLLIRKWRLASIWALTIVLVGFVAAAFLLFQNLQTLIASGENRHKSYFLADELRQSSDDLTRLVRTFAVTGNQRFKQQFWEVLAIRNGKSPRPRAYNQIFWDMFAIKEKLPSLDGENIPLRDMMVKQGIADDELALLQQAQQQSDALVTIEEVAMRAVTNRMTAADEKYRKPGESNQEMAVRILHGAEYHQAKVAIMGPIQMFLKKLNERTEAEYQGSAKDTQILFILCVVFTVLSFILAIIIMILGRRISIDEDSILEKSRSEANKAKFLREALEKEKEYNSLQREFISMVSHEFRTPLTIIDGSAQRLKRRKETITPDELEKRSDKIRVAVDGMVMLMEKLLFSGRLDEGKIEFSPQAHDLKAIIASSCDHQAEISLNHDFCMDLDGLPPTICADISLLNQVFQNLLSNAVKYSQNSRFIEVNGWTEGDMAMVSVTDHGVGIPEDEQPKLFKRFFRASTSEGIAGTGLGLSLCKSFVTMHGGDIEVDSIEGAGTTFIVKLPIGGVANEKMTA